MKCKTMRAILSLSVRATLGLAVLAFTIGMSSCLNDDNKIPPNCFDGILNNGEDLIDCGGPICAPCDPCENGVWDPLLGEQWVDCGGECAPCDLAFNGQMDPGETGIDCGGTTGIACGELCGDGLLNGNEIDVDCGGLDCDACPTCTDDEMNGDEIGIDCGGPDCAPCPTTGDCTNGLLDGDELYIDCGGSTCPDCEGIITWKATGTDYAADFSTSCTLAGGTLTINGVSITTDELSIALEEPDLVGWQDGVSITCNTNSAPGSVATYASASGGNFSTNVAGANFTVDITYILAESGGIVVGTFSGSLLGVGGSGGITLSQGTFILPID
ncbi:MAG: hypothetical protein P8M07_03145 [Flavobacteriales bacterium]|nr:hypothetical protein [Flavobacteriales bacterium]